MKYQTQFVRNLIDEVLVLRAKVKIYESGDLETLLRKAHAEEMAVKDKEIADLKRQLCEAHEENRLKDKYFAEVLEDVQKESKRQLSDEEKAEQALIAKLKYAEKALQDALGKIATVEKECDALKSQNETLTFEVKKLKIRLSRTSQDSSFTSNHDKALMQKAENDDDSEDETESDEKTEPVKSINQFNERLCKGIENDNAAAAKDDTKDAASETTTKKPYHPPVVRAADKIVEIDSSEFENNPDRYEPLDKIETRQLVETVTTMLVTDYRVKLYRDRETGNIVHAPFPAGLESKVNYGVNIDTLLLMLTDVLNSSQKRALSLLDNMCPGIAPSAGYISGLCDTFVNKAQPELDKIEKDLADSPVLHADFTFGDLNGNEIPILMLVTKNGVLFQPKESRGLKGIEDSLLKFYKGIIICDGERAFSKFENITQQCLAHIKRYLNAIIKYENLEWAKKMKRWIEKAIHYRNERHDMGEDFEDEVVAELEREYDEILELAKKEYEENPPKKYFTTGKNSFERLCEKEKFVLFLHDMMVDPTNNAAEIEARQVKRKLAEAMCFRSRAALEAYCKCLSVLETWKLSGENVYEKIKEVFARPSTRRRGRPRKSDEDKTKETT